MDRPRRRIGGPFRNAHAHPARGFALVVTISLMVLLMILSVGLLSLSAVCLRASSSGEAMAQARSQARLGLMLALGELQAAAGTDRAITAPASILDEQAPDGVTGVWRAWEAADREGRGSKECGYQYN